MVLISIIVPIYNTEEYLAECIESLINQTYKNIEIILVNDGSTDRSTDICFSYTEKDKRIRVIKQFNQGVSAARNAGIDNAKGTYITFVDSDDYVTNKYCEMMLNTIQKYNTDFVYFGQYSLHRSQLRKIRTRITDGLYSTSYILNIVIDDGTICGFLLHSTCAVLYKAEILNNFNVRFDKSIHHNEDGYFNLLYCLNSNLIYIKQSVPIYIYRVNKNSASHKKLDIDAKYGVLNKKIEELDAIYPEIGFGLQLQRRKLTLVLEQIIKSIYLPKKQWKKETIELLKNKIVEKSFSVIDKEKLDINKKVLFILLKRNKIGLVYFNLKYIKPILKRMLNR